MKYTIAVSRTVTVTNTYEVEAENICEAERLAEEQAYNDVFDYSGIEGEYTCEDVSEIN